MQTDITLTFPAWIIIIIITIAPFLIDLVTNCLFVKPWFLSLVFLCKYLFSWYSALTSPSFLSSLRTTYQRKGSVWCVLVITWIRKSEQENPSYWANGHPFLSSTSPPPSIRCEGDSYFSRSNDHSQMFGKPLAIFLTRSRAFPVIVGPSLCSFPHSLACSPLINWFVRSCWQ